MSQSNQGKITALYCRLSQDDGLDGGVQQHPKPKENIRAVRPGPSLSQHPILCG